MKLKKANPPQQQDWLGNLNAIDNGCNEIISAAASLIVTNFQYCHNMFNVRTKNSGFSKACSVNVIKCGSEKEKQANHSAVRSNDVDRQPDLIWPLEKE